MTAKLEYLIDLIFDKLKKHKAKKISLKKENLQKFIFSLLSESEFKENK